MCATGYSARRASSSASARPIAAQQRTGFPGSALVAFALEDLALEALEGGEGLQGGEVVDIEGLELVDGIGVEQSLVEPEASSASPVLFNALENFIF